LAETSVIEGKSSETSGTEQSGPNLPHSPWASFYNGGARGKDLVLGLVLVLVLGLGLVLG